MVKVKDLRPFVLHPGGVDGGRKRTVPHVHKWSAELFHGAAVRGVLDWRAQIPKGQVREQSGNAHPAVVFVIQIKPESTVVLGDVAHRRPDHASTGTILPQTIVRFRWVHQLHWRVQERDLQVVQVHRVEQSTATESQREREREREREERRATCLSVVVVVLSGLELRYLLRIVYIRYIYRYLHKILHTNIDIYIHTNSTYKYRYIYYTERVQVVKRRREGVGQSPETARGEVQELEARAAGEVWDRSLKQGLVSIEVGEHWWAGRTHTHNTESKSESGS